MKRAPLSADVLLALAEANRGRGWNNRSREVRRFDVEGDFGRGCTLYVVPFRRWRNRRSEQLAAAWHSDQKDATG